MKDLREIDALVERHIFGRDVIFVEGQDRWLEDEHGTFILQPGDSYYQENGYDVPVAGYSSQIRPAWQVVEKLAERGMYFQISTEPPGFDVTFEAIIRDGNTGTWDRNGSYDGYVAEAQAKTAPLAICLAALKACGVEVE